jgi:hypothetical protein
MPAKRKIASTLNESNIFCLFMVKPPSIKIFKSRLLELNHFDAFSKIFFRAGLLSPPFSKVLFYYLAFVFYKLLCVIDMDTGSR